MIRCKFVSDNVVTMMASPKSKCSLDDEDTEEEDCFLTSPAGHFMHSAETRRSARNLLLAKSRGEQERQRRRKKEEEQERQELKKRQFSKGDGEYSKCDNGGEAAVNARDDAVTTTISTTSITTTEGESTEEESPAPQQFRKRFRLCKSKK